MGECLGSTVCLDALKTSYVSWFQNSTVFLMLYSLFWVIPRRLNCEWIFPGSRRTRVCVCIQYALVILVLQAVLWRFMSRAFAMFGRISRFSTYLSLSLLWNEFLRNLSVYSKKQCRKWTSVWFRLKSKT
jgi:hypothetical protein